MRNVPGGFVCVIVPTACARESVADGAFEKFRSNVSSGPPPPSAQMVTETVFNVSPGLKVSVLLVAS